MPTMHEVDYEIKGDDMQFVRIQLDPGEAVVAEAGSMIPRGRHPDGHRVRGRLPAEPGFMGALLGAKRLLTGESLFMTVFHNESREKRWAAFAAPYPGKIQAMHLSARRGDHRAEGLVPRRREGREHRDRLPAALRRRPLRRRRVHHAAPRGGRVGVRERGRDLGGAHAAPGETLRVDTGCLVALQPTVQYDIQFVGKLKSALFGGEGLSSRLRGPGRVWLQSLPFSRLAGRIYAAAPQTGRRRQEEDRSSGVSGT